MLNWLSTAKKNTTSSFDMRASAPFYASDGSTLWTLRDLGDSLVRISDDTFYHHVSAEKNDFSNWLVGCFPPRIASIGEQLRNLSRDEMVKLLVALQQGKPVPKPSQVTNVETHAIAPAEEHRPALILPPPKTVLADRHVSPAHLHEKKAEHVELHPKPLPLSPLHSVRDHHIKQIRDELNSLRVKAAVDSIAAKEEFITVRTKVWRDFSEDERKEILPQLREVYEFLLQTH